MNDLLSTRHVLTYRALFLFLCLLVILFKLLPLDLHSTGWPAPDLLLALTLAWLLRQPAVVPIGSILVVFLLADFLFERPPGLWTLLVIVISESLRTRRMTMTEMPFLVEWSAFAGAVLSMVLLNQVALWLLMVEPPSLGLSLVHGIITAAIYPLVVAVSKFIFGLRKIGSAEAEAL